MRGVRDSTWAEGRRTCARQQAKDNEEIQGESSESRSTELTGAVVELSDLLKREEEKRGLQTSFLKKPITCQCSSTV